MPKRLIILGAGGNAADILDIVDALNSLRATWDVVGLLDDAAQPGAAKYGGRSFGKLAEAASLRRHLVCQRDRQRGQLPRARAHHRRDRRRRQTLCDARSSRRRHLARCRAWCWLLRLLRCISRTRRPRRPACAPRRRRDPRPRLRGLGLYARCAGRRHQRLREIGSNRLCRRGSVREAEYPGRRWRTDRLRCRGGA